MKRELLRRLDIGTPGATKRFKGLMEEDPETAQRRDELMSKIEKLEKIKSELHVLA